jgi:hypothetical protein
MWTASLRFDAVAPSRKLIQDKELQFLDGGCLRWTARLTIPPRLGKPARMMTEREPASVIRLRL